jgi:DnaJ-domain-containing protein 1
MERSIAQLKHRLRQMKRLEIKIRFKGSPVPPGRTLVWDEFFSTRAEQDPRVKYPLDLLLQMGRDERKEVFGEYFYRVYFQNFREHGLTPADVYDPALLSLLGLPPHAGFQEIKQRFRELAKKYHPDLGGDSAQFINLVEIYERLTEG